VENAIGMAEKAAENIVKEYVILTENKFKNKMKNVKMTPAEL
jgi:hypothetical protein